MKNSQPKWQRARFTDHAHWREGAEVLGIPFKKLIAPFYVECKPPETGVDIEGQQRVGWRTNILKPDWWWGLDLDNYLRVDQDKIELLPEFTEQAEADRRFREEAEGKSLRDRLAGRPRPNREAFEDAGSPMLSEDEDEDE